MGQPEFIGSRAPFRNIGQCKGLQANIQASLWANLGLPEAGSLFTTLANAKACIKLFMHPCGPTWAYQKRGAREQRRPMRRPACEYSRVTLGHAELIRSGQPIQNAGQCEGQHGNIYMSLRTISSLSEVGGPFLALANAKACMEIFMHPCGRNRAYRKQGAHSSL